MSSSACLLSCLPGLLVRRDAWASERPGGQQVPHGRCSSPLECLSLLGTLGLGLSKLELRCHWGPWLICSVGRMRRKGSGAGRNGQALQRAAAETSKHGCGVPRAHEHIQWGGGSLYRADPGPGARTDFTREP